VTTHEWIESDVPSDLEVRQVYGFIFNLDGLLKWGESGRQQVAKAIATGSKLGVFWDGAPLSYIEID